MVKVPKKLQKAISNTIFTIVIAFMALYPFLFVAWLCLRLVMNMG